MLAHHALLQSSRKTAYVALLCALSAHLVYGQSPWDDWPSCARNCPMSAGCDNPTADCVCSSIFIGCIKFTTCNGADEARAMALIDPICGTVDGTTPSPSPPARPNPTSNTPRPSRSPTPTPTPALPSDPSRSPTNSAPTTPPNASTSSPSSQRSDPTTNSNSRTGSSNSISPPSTSLTGSDDTSSTNTDPNVLATIINSGATSSSGAYSEARSSTPGPAIGGAIAGLIVLVGVLWVVLRQKRARKVKNAESGEEKASPEIPEIPIIAAAPGLTPYAYCPPASDSSATESSPSTINDSGKSRLINRSVVNAHDLNSTKMQPSKHHIEPATNHSAMEPPSGPSVNPSGPPPSTEDVTSSPLPSPLATEPSPSPAGARPFSMTSQDIVTTGRELLPPPYHLIPGNT